MSVNITIHAETADQARAEMLALLGNVELTVEGPAPQPGETIVADSAGGTTEGPKTEAPKGNDKPKGTRGKRTTAAAATQQIQTNPENRTNPEDDAQDTADEAADSVAAKPETKLTLDDVRGAAGDYVNKYGIEAAQSDLMDVLEKAAGCRKISELPADDQAKLQAAVEAFKKAAVDNPFKREAAKEAA